MALFSQTLLYYFASLTILVPLVLHNHLVGVSSTTLSITTDKQALITIKSQFSNDNSNPLSSWNQNSSPCNNWTGVKCNKLGQRVTSLDLSGLGLSGQLSPYIGNLSFLQSLQLSNNQLTGAIPDQITNLFRLRVLNMSSNIIEGVIPSNITRMTELQVIDLSSNRIVSRIPQDMSSLRNLQVLKLGKNSLYGAIPASLGNISSLRNISFGTNYLSGLIPSDLGRLKNLIELDLTINNLTGTVPPVIYNLSSLVNLALASNSLWGEIPEDVGHRLPNLLVFNFCFNKFTGGIPGSLHNLTNIQVIRMASNLLEGTVPPGLGNLPFLRMYNIGYNKIVSSGGRGLDYIINSLTNSTQLNFLAIDGNMLEGVIPETIGNLSKDLSKLYMGGNRFNGSIPSSIGRLSGLSLLNLSYNSIIREIPNELGQLEDLQELSLAGNQLSGSIPKSFGNLLNLNHIDLSRNRLVGSIPINFGNLQKLLFVDLSNNKLGGSIPREILNLPTLSNVLNLSMNLLSGPIPQVGNLISVATIDFSNNQLFGDIPSTFSNCHSLEKLFLARNMLSGPIPKSFGEVKGLETLDLSSNQLSGSIPIELENLNVLQLLNLSYNDLEGAIPSGGVFQSLSNVDLEGNKKLCLNLSCVPRGHERRHVYIIIASIVTLILCLTIGLLLYIKNKRVKTTSATSSELLKPHAPMVSYGELRQATNQFSQENLIGTGSFGSVYKGHLSQQGTTVAVKVLDILRTDSLKSFFAECEALKNSRHRNLVKLITSCSSVDFKNNEFLALVYEYLCNGSLEDWIKGKRKHANGNGLSLMERLTIAIDTASALDYLHNDSEIPIVHCDLKPSNILLDDDLTAKVGDFGLARLLIERSTNNQVSISSTHVLKGSIGYIPPEYGWGEKPSTGGDVYSFGIVLLELFTGKSPKDECFTGGLSLTKWVQSAFKDKTNLEVVDPKLLSLIDPDDSGPSPQLCHCVDAVVGVGLSCAADTPDARVGIREAVRQLKAARDSLLKNNDDANSVRPTTERYSQVSIR